MPLDMCYRVGSERTTAMGELGPQRGDVDDEDDSDGV